MKNQKQNILDLLRRNFFLTKEAKSAVVEKIDALSPTQLELLLTLLTEADAKQIDLLTKIAIKQPEFIKNLESYTHQAVRKALEESEVSAVKKDTFDLEKIEAEIKAI